MHPGFPFPSVEGADEQLHVLQLSRFKGKPPKPIAELNRDFEIQIDEGLSDGLAALK